MEKRIINKYGFWVISGLLLLAMIIINLTLYSPISDFACISAVFAAEVLMLILDVACFGYKDSNMKLWLSGDIVAIIIGISIVVFGSVYIQNFGSLDNARPWMYMGGIVTLIYIVSAHHVLLCKHSKK